MSPGGGNHPEPRGLAVLQGVHLPKRPNHKHTAITDRRRAAGYQTLPE
jgi:hypothetical protein